MRGESCGAAEMEKRFVFIMLTLLAVCFTFLFCDSSVLGGSFGRDSSVFYTIGRGIVQNRVAYKDLFDHKGLLLYFFNALGVLIADRYVLGLWLVETIFVVVDCFLIFRFACKITASDWTAFLTSAFTLVFTSIYWEGGNLTETYGLMPELLTFVLLLDAFEGEKDRPFPARIMFVIGVCAGVELFLRVNMVMAWIPVAVIVIGLELRNRNYRNAGIILLYGVLGVLVASLIPLCYCLEHDCLAEMLFASFLFNLRYVGNGPSLSAFLIRAYNLCFFLLAAGLGICSVALVWRKRRRRTERFLFLFSFLFAVVSVLLSGRLYVHYNLYLIPFLIPFLGYTVSLLNNRLGKRSILLLLCFLTAVSVVRNSSFARDAVKRMLHYSGTDYAVQEIIASKLETEYPGVRNILVANGSSWYYTRLNVVPEERYFYLPSIDYNLFPDAVDAQADDVMQGSAEAVILTWADPGGKLWLPNGERNKEINVGLERHYTEFFSAGDTSLYFRNDIVA